MFGMVREVRYWTNYVLEKARNLLRNMSIQDPRHN